MEQRPSYLAVMERGTPFIRLTLEVDQPIELGEFVGAFTALAAEYERYVRAQPGIEATDAQLFVREVRQGSIIAEIVEWAAKGIEMLGAANTISDFVEKYGTRLKAYLRKGGRAPDATQGELKDFSAQVAAIANAHGSRLTVAALRVENGEEKTEAIFRFDTAEAREIQQRVEEHQHELKHRSRADHSRVLMTFVRPDIRAASLGKRSGELVEITSISDLPRPLIYASEMAEQQIKAQIADEDSVFNRGFVVDVNVEIRRGRPVAYAVTNVHQIIDLD